MSISLLILADFSWTLIIVTKSTISKQRWLILIITWEITYPSVLVVALSSSREEIKPSILSWAVALKVKWLPSTISTFKVHLDLLYFFIGVVWSFLPNHTRASPKIEGFERTSFRYLLVTASNFQRWNNWAFSIWLWCNCKNWKAMKRIYLFLWSVCLLIG